MKVISIGMFVPGNQPVVWRGPMLHRALEQFLADVFWGDLDVLLLDLPPGTGDIAISSAQLLPSAEILVVTTPQAAAAEVAERAGAIALQTHQQIAGVVENMSWLAHAGRHRGWSCSAAAAAARWPTRWPLDRRPGAAAGPGPAGRRGCARAATPGVAGGAVRPRLGRGERLARDGRPRWSNRARGLAGRKLGLTPVGR